MGRNERIRREIAHEAARLMFEEGFREYPEAKRAAARRFGPARGKPLGAHLPTNAEIQVELSRLIQFYEADLLPERLLRLRMLALKYLELFEPFAPLLVGALLEGAVREVNDIELHLFAEDGDEVTRLLDGAAIPFREERRHQRLGKTRIETLLLVIEEGENDILCTIYPLNQRRQQPRSDLRAAPLERLDAAGLRRLISAGLDGSVPQGRA